MKNQSLIAISILAVGVGLALGYALWGETDGKYASPRHTGGTEVPAGMHRMPDGSLMGNASVENEMDMMNNMDHSMMMVKSEREFLEGMIPHHQEAVDTAKEVIARGGSTPAIKKLAEDIVVAQEKEITLMKTWYQNWYGSTYVTDPAVYEPMMRDLSKLSGASLDKVFLEDMVMHHMGAIMMAESVQPYIEHLEMTNLTKAIVETQTAEIQLMRDLSNDL
jgi:uncharacterized protein (DUF305 family)